MKIPIHQVDAFADRPFAGNPAAVCPLEEWIEDDLMQSIAAENNLSETAFLVRNGEDWDLRWFTPVSEVDLCGHATMASGWVVLERIDPGRDRARFHTRSGRLTVERDGDRLALDLPAQPPRPAELPAEYRAALGGTPRETLRGGYTMVVYEDEAAVAALAPDQRALAQLEPLAVMVTAPAADSETDFVSRFFAPAQGIPEDPVTGSAHTTLVPFWAHRLNKRVLRARQISPRGGALHCEERGDRVRLSGQVVPYLEGTLTVRAS